MCNMIIVITVTSFSLTLRIVKLTSPLLNYFTVVGAIMLYLSVITYTLPGFTEVINGIKCYVC